MHFLSALSLCKPLAICRKHRIAPFLINLDAGNLDQVEDGSFTHSFPKSNCLQTAGTFPQFNDPPFEPPVRPCPVSRYVVDLT